MSKSNTEHEQPIDWWTILSDLEFLTDPYPTLKRLQKRGTLHFDPETNIFFVLGHDGFSRIVKAPQMGRDTRKWKGGWNSPEYRDRDPIGYQLYSGSQPQMINCDGDDHARMRGVYAPAFRAQMMSDLAPMIKAESARLIEQLPLGKTVNFIEAYAAPLPLRVLGNLFDIPPSMDSAISKWSSALIRLADIMMSPEQKLEALTAQNELKAYLSEQIALRRKNPGDSLMDMAIRALDDGTLSEEETLTNLVSMFIAGHETTVTLIGNGMFLLLKNSDQMNALRQDNSSMRSAVEEFLRFEPGGNMILRIALEDYELEGTIIPAGAMVIGMIGAVNRDPNKFDNPDQFDMNRSPNPQYTFGGGAHICIGAPLARMEAHIAFSALLEKFSTIELAGTPQWRLDRRNARGMSNLPVRLEI
ncbi:cytochrome P450 [Magnetovibrio blakemorei]|uniref:Cytochrome n=1 Tax=Magnetovibrio blakemorei TaxID=28181 RepID=A0A1E5QAS9_9PROT|nr:cytochrome P450 [Magnetovibrio blakemorei]OEJ69012.1 hypothetical protein BEN30_04655 [Magnetovibrio blakemorei]